MITRTQLWPSLPRVPSCLCGGFRPVVTDPAEISISDYSTFDHDEDGIDDSVEMSYQVLSQAFYERVSVQIEAVGADGEVISTMTNNMIVGNSVP